jgi:hypothetical protein
MTQPEHCVPPILYATCQACNRPSNYRGPADLTHYDPGAKRGRLGWYLTCGFCGAEVPVSDAQVAAARSKEELAAEASAKMEEPR